MVVAGVMSGTSADGVDVALVRISPPTEQSGTPKLRVLGHETFAYPKPVRNAVLQAMDARQTSVRELARLNWRLGELYADAVEKAMARLGVKIALVGLHGQTIYHQARAEKYLASPVRATWQIGEAAVVAERLHVPVISDLRSSDLAAGGQGAPLVPMLDYCMFRSRSKNRLLLNLGGIANMTAIPAKAALQDVMAFDTGPANMVIDALMQSEFGMSFDRAGRVGAQGNVLGKVVSRIMLGAWFLRPPPKSCGREDFGADFAESFRQQCLRAGGVPADLVATATELTSASIIDAYARYCQPHFALHDAKNRKTELIAAGGGTRNNFMMSRLRIKFAEHGVRLMTSDECGVATQAKEAVAFALLAWLSWHVLPGNVPSATGADRAVILGKVSSV